MSPQSSSKSVARSQSESIGSVTHYFAKASAAVVELNEGTLRVGDTLHIHGHTTDFLQRVDSIRIDDSEIESASAPVTIGLKLDQPARTGDRVDRVIA